MSPPDGFTGSRPWRAVSPSSVARPALPGGTRPVSSSEMSSKGVNASWISATSTRSGPNPAIANASRAAACVALKLVSAARWRRASVSLPCPMPATRTAARRAVNTTAAAPSEMGQQWSSRSGSATMRLSSTSSSVTAWRKWACGFWSPFAWFFTATCASSRAPTPFAIRARVTRPASAGIVAPYERS